MTIRTRFIVPLTLVTAAACATSASRAPTPGTGAFVVDRVVDGDTIVVRARGDPTPVKVRLIGVDTPETVDPRRPAGCYGAEASAFVHRLLGTGARVDLRYDAERRDRYGRTLAYVYLGDGRMLNALLVEQGYATVLTVPPNVAHAAELAGAERRARAAARGLWDLRVCPTTP